MKDNTGAGPQVRAPRSVGTAMDMLEHATILIVDDSTMNLATLSSLLRPQFHVLAATSGEDCLRIVAGPRKPDLILLDIVMPGLSGYDVLARLREREDTRAIPVIFLTSLLDPVDEEQGLKAGAADYLTKPILPAVVLARVRTHLEAKQARDWLRNRNALLEAEVARRMAENDMIQQVSIRALAKLAEKRDPETGNHILRTQAYVQRLAIGLRTNPRFAATLTDHYINLLVRSAPLHDIGKVGIPDQILLKPGRLTPEERVIMETHAALGSDAIEQAEREVAMPLEFLSLAREIAHWHHERWDGTGYPDRLAGEAIPVSARLMALADVFDALTSARVYKPALSYVEARTVIAAGRATHFDPAITDLFLASFDDFVAIAERYREDDAKAQARAASGEPAATG